MISVVLPTRNPHPGRLQRTLQGLTAQSLPSDAWELLLVDNASDRAWSVPDDLAARLPGLRRLHEPRLGLTPARLCGIAAARGDVLVFVDDDNVLDPGYLATAAALFAARPTLGAAGGPVVPEWETPPPDWSAEFHGLLALRDLGPRELVAPGAASAAWPAFAPVGAGLCVRRDFATLYAADLATQPRRLALDRAGNSLASGGDNDLVFTVLHGGGDVAYFPTLRLTHLIPSGRLDAAYLARLNRGVMRTWVRVLSLHGQCPWPPVPPSTLALRVARAWFRFAAWRGPAHHIRWSGARGQFEGQADLWRETHA